MFGPICLTNPKSLEFLKKLSGCPQSVLERQQEIDCKSCFFRLFCNPPAFSWLGIKIKGYQRVIYCWVLTKRPLKPGSCIFMVKIGPMLQFSNTKKSYKMFNHNVFNSDFFFFQTFSFSDFFVMPLHFHGQDYNPNISPMQKFVLLHRISSHYQQIMFNQTVFCSYTYNSNKISKI